MSSTSNASLSGSSAAANTVVVTARDIEFSNYNSSTGKWGNAVLTMMIEDTNTPDNINLEVYNEKVYAVFRNHDDPTDVIQTSAEVDGMDFRVTISNPMVASGKYELYKVYGETSHSEYATTSQFYIQVPGKVWDFTNDTVDHDVELVSDWFNYGYIKDTNDVIHGVTTKDELRDAVSASSDSTVFTVDGTSLTRQDVKGVKITSMLDSDLRLTTSNTPSFLNKYDNVEEVDIVSAKVTKLMRNVNDNFTYEGEVSNSYDCIGFSIPKINQKIAFPETLRFLTFMASSPITGTSVFNKPIYMPDSVTVSQQLLAGHNNKGIFNSKVRFSPNLNHVVNYNLYGFSNWNHPIEPIGQNYQLTGTSLSFLGFSGYNQPFTIPSVWTYVPSGFLYYTSQFDQDIIIPSNIVNIQSSAFGHLNLGGDGVTKKVILPSTITTIGNSAFYYLGRTTAGVEVDMSNCVNIASYGASFEWSTIKDFKWPSRFASNNISIMNNAFSYSIFKIDPDPNTNFVEFALPEGISEIGNAAFVSIYRSANMKVVMPSTLTKIGHSCFYFWSTNNTKKMYFDFTKLNPDDVVIDDRLEYNGLRNDVPGFAVIPSDYSSSWYDLTIEVAPGTQEAWEAKLPDFKLVNPDWASNTTFSRKINWVETPTQYAYVFYETNYYDDTPTKGYVELQSMTDFNKLVNGPNAVSDAAVIVDTDDQGNTIELHFGNGSRSSQGTNINTITGVYVGTDITAIPDHFLRSYRYVKKFKWGGNETSVGSYLCYNAGQYLKEGDRTVSYDLVNIPDTVVSIGTDFFSNARYLDEQLHFPTALSAIPMRFMLSCTSFNQQFTIPNTVISIGDSFMAACTSFNQPVSVPSTVTELNYFGNSWTSFNQPFTIESTVTKIISLFSNCTSFNQSITIPSSVTYISGFLRGCISFNQTVSIPQSVTYCANFLSNCTSFNQPFTVHVGCSITGVLENCTSFNSAFTVDTSSGRSHNGKNFVVLSGCTSFNQPVDFSSVNGTNQFEILNGCTSFNSSIIMPSYIRMGGYMQGCTSFNQPLTLPAVSESFYNSQLKGLSSFNQPVTIPSSWGDRRWYNRATLFEGCDSLTSAVTMDAAVPSSSSSDTTLIEKSFSTTNGSAACYTTGVTFTGTNAQAWKNLMPDYDGSQTTPAGIYRKINVV